MEYPDINPQLHSAARFSWHFNNPELSVAYEMRIFSIHEGTALLTLGDGREYRLRSGAALLTAPGQPYRFRRDESNEPFELYCVSYVPAWDERPYIPPCRQSMFHPEYLAETRKRLTPEDCFPLVLAQAGGIDGLLVRIYEEHFSENRYRDEICSGLLKEALFTALRLSGQETRESRAPAEDKAREALRWIDAHFRYPVGEKDVAAAMNYHPYYLSRITKRYFGVTPYRYLIECRVREAERLLEHTNLSVAEIAEYCGYADPTLFYAVFRRETGSSPTEFRRARKQQK